MRLKKLRVGEKSLPKSNPDKTEGPSSRSTVVRLPERGAYDRETVFSILDEGKIAHVGFVHAEQPYVIPMVYARDEEDLLLHGSSASRIVKNLQEEIPLFVTVTLLDGLVLARSAFHHSMNYRSVVILGKAKLIASDEEKQAASIAMVEHIVPGRSKEIRGPNAQELKATTFLRLPLDESSAKIRTGPPIDDEPDYDLPVWAGEIPIRQTYESPLADPRLLSGIALPSYLRTTK